MMGRREGGAQETRGQNRRGCLGRWGATGTRGTYFCSKWHAYRAVVAAIRKSPLSPFVI